MLNNGLIDEILTEEQQYQIASAPELLEALQEAYKELQFHNWHNTTTGMLIQRTINKATGN